MGYFPTNLRVLRSNNKKTQQEISDTLGIKKSSYASYEEGRAEPPSALLIKISELFMVSLNDLVIVNLSQRTPEQNKENLFISRYNLADGNVKGAIDCLLNIV